MWKRRGRRLGSVRTPQLKPFGDLPGAGEGGALLHTLLFVAPILLSAMPGFIHVGQFVAEMLLCEQTYDAFIKGEIVVWYDSANKGG